ncbi:hypothetical protein PT2222_10007 [Paraburkholderia tropica]
MCLGVRVHRCRPGPGGPRAVDVVIETGYPLGLYGAAIPVFCGLAGSAFARMSLGVSPPRQFARVTRP